MKYFLAALAIVALASGSALGVSITVNGDISDWQVLGLVHDDPIGENDPDGAGPKDFAVDISHYGATVIGNTFYAFMQVTRPVTSFYRGPAPGAWINADRNLATTLSEDFDTVEGEIVKIPLEPAGLIGTDINVEIDYPDNALPLVDVKCWGGDGYAVNAIGTAEGWAAKDSEYVMEWSVPVKTVIDALAGLPGEFGTVNSAGPWRVTIGGEGKIDGDLSWGRDLATPLDINVLLPGDANVSGTTDATDLNTVLSYYNQTGTDWSKGDFNGDGNTDATDLNTVLSYYNQTLGMTGGSLQTSSVPEPSSIVMLATLSALVGAWVIRRRG